MLLADAVHGLGFQKLDPATPDLWPRRSAACWWRRCRRSPGGVLYASASSQAMCTAAGWASCTAIPRWVGAGCKAAAILRLDRLGSAVLWPAQGNYCGWTLLRYFSRLLGSEAFPFGAAMSTPGPVASQLQGRNCWRRRGSHHTHSHAVVCCACSPSRWQHAFAHRIKSHCQVVKGIEKGDMPELPLLHRAWG